VAAISSGTGDTGTTGVKKPDPCRAKVSGTWAANTRGGHPVRANDSQVVFGGRRTSFDPPQGWNGTAGRVTLFAHQRCHITVTAETGSPPPSVNEGNQLRLEFSGPDGITTETTPWPITGDDSPTQTAEVGVFHGPGTIRLQIKSIGTGLQFWGNARVTGAISADV